MFQSTHPHGVRPLAIQDKINNTRFNPRTHMGCDARKQHVEDQHQVSIHAPTWGATLKWLKTCEFGRFQSTHPHGVRPHIQQKAEYHIAKVYNLRRKTKRIILKEIKAKK